MTLQVVPLISQMDMFDINTYKELGWRGAIFAIVLLLFVFCVVKGHIKIWGFGPNEGGIRELFGISLWSVGPGPHLHIAGILPVRKVSFASKEVDVVSAARSGTHDDARVYIYDIGVNLAVRRDKESIRRRVYEAEDTNRGDAENNEALRQAGDLAADLIRRIVSSGTSADDIEAALILEWGIIEEQEIGDTNFENPKSTYGHGIKSVNVRSLVEREYSEIARAIREGSLSRGDSAAVATLFGQRSA